MQGLTQNWSWILIVVAVVAFFYLRRGHGRRGGFDLGGHGHGGFGIDGGRGHHRQDNPDDGDWREAPSPQPPEVVVDPVSGTAVHTAGAITSVYQGKVYYFESKENRDRFEVTPQDYANKVQGIAIEGSDSADRHRHRHHGC